MQGILIPYATLIFCVIWLFISYVKMEFSWILNSDTKQIVSYSRDIKTNITHSICPISLQMSSFMTWLPRESSNRDLIKKH